MTKKKPFNNKLSPAEIERLALLAEECGEVVQVIGKILRHGYESYHPNGHSSNRELLTNELGDLYAAIKMMTDTDDLKMIEVLDAAEDKKRRVAEYLHHQ